MKVVFDFDDVIFDAKTFKAVIFCELEKRGVSDVQQKYEKERESGKPFSLYAFIRATMTDTSEVSVDEVYQCIKEQAKHLLNTDIVSLMQKLGRENCYILTNGEKDFQTMKIEKSGAVDLAQEVIVVSGGKSDALRSICEKHRDEEIIFVDDRLTFINEVKGGGYENLKTVFFNEHGYENLLSEIVESKKAEDSTREMIGAIKNTSNAPEGNLYRSSSFEMH